MSGISVLIAEHGAQWNQWALAWCGPGRELVLLAQHDRESALSFLERVDEGLNRQCRRKLPVQQVVVVGAARHDQPSLLTRAQMLRLIRARLADVRQPPVLMLDVPMDTTTSPRPSELRTRITGVLGDGPANDAAPNARNVPGTRNVPSTRNVPGTRNVPSVPSTRNMKDMLADLQDQRRRSGED